MSKERREQSPDDPQDQGSVALDHRASVSPGRFRASYYRAAPPLPGSCAGLKKPQGICGAGFRYRDKSSSRERSEAAAHDNADQVEPDQRGF